MRLLVVAVLLLAGWTGTMRANSVNDGDCIDDGTNMICTFNVDSPCEAETLATDKSKPPCSACGDPYPTLSGDDTEKKLNATWASGIPLDTAKLSCTNDKDGKCKGCTLDLTLKKADVECELAKNGASCTMSMKSPHCTSIESFEQPAGLTCEKSGKCDIVTAGEFQSISAKCSRANLFGKCEECKMSVVPSQVSSSCTPNSDGTMCSAPGGEWSEKCSLWPGTKFTCENCTDQKPVGCASNDDKSTIECWPIPEKFDTVNITCDNLLVKPTDNCTDCYVTSTQKLDPVSTSCTFPSGDNAFCKVAQDYDFCKITTRFSPQFPHCGSETATCEPATKGANCTFSPAIHETIGGKNIAKLTCDQRQIGKERICTVSACHLYVDFYKDRPCPFGKSRTHCTVSSANYLCNIDARLDVNVKCDGEGCGGAASYSASCNGTSAGIECMMNNDIEKRITNSVLGCSADQEDLCYDCTLTVTTDFAVRVQPIVAALLLPLILLFIHGL